MTSITHGSVTIEDGVKAKEEYAPARKVAVAIHFQVPEGEDGEAHIHAAGALAHAHVDRLLGRKTATPVPEALATATPVKTGRKKETPAQVVEKPPVDELDAAEATVAAEPEEDNFDDPIPPKGAVVEITDAELNDAAQKCKARTNNAVAIRELIASFNPDPTKQFQLRQIAQEQRASFVAQLDDIKVLTGS